MQQYRDIDGGFEVVLDLWWSKSAPRIFFEEHAQHYSIEFRNLFQTAAEQLAAAKP